MASPPRYNHVPTLIAIALLAYLIAVALHEHLGHAAACVALGSKPLELGAFYVSCDDARLSALGIKLVAIAGPLVSALVGALAFALLPRSPAKRPEAWLFTWLLATLGLMNGTGYLFFSGVAGIGDLGVGEDGALAGVAHSGLWRIAFAAVGGALYYASVRFSVKRIEHVLPGTGSARVAFGKRMTLTAYAAGAVLYIGIGALNPHGIVIVLVSSMASSLGGTSGFCWMMETLDRAAPESAEPLVVRRRTAWIAAAVAACAAYGAILGPTIRP